MNEAEHAFQIFNTEKEVAQAVRNAFVKKVRGLAPPAANTEDQLIRLVRDEQKATLRVEKPHGLI